MRNISILINSLFIILIIFINTNEVKALGLGFDIHYNNSYTKPEAARGDSWGGIGYMGGDVKRIDKFTPNLGLALGINIHIADGFSITSQVSGSWILYCENNEKGFLSGSFPGMDVEHSVEGSFRLGILFRIRDSYTLKGK